MNKRFRNMLERSSKVYVNKSIFGQTLSTSDIVKIFQTASKEEQTRLINSMRPYTKGITGSDAYWSDFSKQLRTVTEEKVQWATFESFSTTDVYWKDLFRLLTGKNKLPSLKERRKLLLQNPYICTQFFILICNGRLLLFQCNFRFQ